MGWIDTDVCLECEAELGPDALEDMWCDESCQDAMSHRIEEIRFEQAQEVGR